MRRYGIDSWWLRLTLGMGLLLGLPGVTQAGEKRKLDPIELTSQAQLFVDDFLIQERKGLARSLHTPSKAKENPVLVADRPWEGGLSLESGTVLYEPDRGIFRMWYNALPARTFRSVKGKLCC